MISRVGTFLEEEQRNAWINEIAILKEGLKDITFARVIFEYSIYSNSDPAVYEQVSKCWCKLAETCPHCDEILIYDIPDFFLERPQRGPSYVRRCSTHILFVIGSFILEPLHTKIIPTIAINTPPTAS